jgi:Kelch motif
MLHPRASGTATLLADGRVLLTGGYSGEGQPPQSTAEVYDPEAGQFEPVASMRTARAEQSATLTPDGRVLIAGGRNADGQALRSTEWFDPDTDMFTPGRPLDVARTVLVAGGYDPSIKPTAHAWLVRVK